MPLRGPSALLFAAFSAIGMLRLALLLCSWLPGFALLGVPVPLPVLWQWGSTRLPVTFFARSSSERPEGPAAPPVLSSCDCFQLVKLTPWPALPVKARAHVCIGLTLREALRLLSLACGQFAPPPSPSRLQVLPIISRYIIPTNKQ